MTHLARAGIAVVFVDFRTRMFDNTTRSIEILGELLGRQDARASSWRSVASSWCASAARWRTPTPGPA